MENSQTTFRYLTEDDIEKVNFVFDKENTFDTMRIGTLADGSCFFHAILRSHFNPYIRQRVGENPVNRRELVKEFRKELADKLDTDIDVNEKGKTYYDYLARGKMKELSLSLPRTQLEAMKNILDSDEPIDNIFNEYISLVINKDIYILDLITRDVYVTGNDLDILYLNRDSIVIGYIPGHYELIGLKRGDKLITLFSSNNPFIVAIRRRLLEKIRRES